ncbi:MAG: glycosyltransferase family A protein [Bryobacterales bacterium]
MSTAQPNLVSVIMPAYNGRQYLRQAIDSLFEQTHAEWELVFVDDGSTDDTAAIAQSYSDPRVRYFHQVNAGQAAALNRGLDEARGEFITTLDVDDWYTPDSLTARVEKLRQDPSLVAVYGDGVYCTPEGKEIKRFRDLIPVPPEGDILPDLISNPLFGTGASIVERRSALDRYSIRYDETIFWCQDYDFYLRLAEAGPFGRVAIPTVWYRQHDANMTATMPSERRIGSLFRTKMRVAETDRFAAMGLEPRARFFYELLRNDLYGFTALQHRAIESAAFAALPAHEQARLLRLVGVGYVANNSELEFAAECIGRAKRTLPSDVKSQVLAFLLKLDIRLAQRAVRMWSAPNAGRA